MDSTMIKWPWVSRHRLEQVETQLEAVNKERRELLDRLLGSGQPARELRAQVRRVEQVEDAEIETEPVREQESPVQFTTPFDRIEKRFEQARSQGKPMDPRFRARA